MLPGVLCASGRPSRVLIPACFSRDCVLVIRSPARRFKTPFSASLNFSLSATFGIGLLGFAEETFEDGHAVADLLERQEMGFVAVVEVGGVVADFVGQVD